MYAKVGAALLLAATIASNAASACERIDACDLRAYMTRAEFEEFKKHLRDSKRSRPHEPASQGSPSAPLITKASPPASAATPTSSRSDVVPPPTTSIKFLLRKDFEDIRLFSDIVSNTDAEGAEFSVTRDRIANDTTWVADALAAVAYIYKVEDIHSTFMGVAVAPYVKVNREFHSSKIDNNIDAKTLGLSGEVGFRNRLFGKSDHFRGNVAVIEDDVNDNRAAHATGEWIPYYLSDARTVPGTYLNYNFIPELIAEYDSTTQSGKTIMFSDRQRSLRIGPEATVRFKVVTPDSFLYDYFKRLTGAVTYHWWTESYSRRQDSWLDASLTYNLDEEGHIGLKFDYKRGRSEDTGAQSDLYKVTLTAKTCADLATGTSC